MSEPSVLTVKETAALWRVESEARAYAGHTHGNLTGSAYRAREEARDRLLDALAELDVTRLPRAGPFALR